MYEFFPYFTNDGSVGLYSEKDNDIYHSTYGALTEAYEKFILPANFEKYFEKNSEIKILDICYGIGYNSKSFVNFLYNAAIYSDNINRTNCIGKLDNDNIFCKKTACEDKKNINFAFYDKNLKIYIKAIDTDEILALISPLIICNKKNLPANYKLPFVNEKISKMLNKPPKTKINFHDEINLIFYEKITKTHPEIFQNPELAQLLRTKEYHSFFEPDICRLFTFDKNKRYSFTPLRGLWGFLHNIYYRYLFNRYKIASKWLKNNDFIFDLKIEDARKELLRDENMYNFIFLDAFTAAKCPALWSLDFFKLLFKHLEQDGMIMTYSNSAAVRNAFIHAGFYVGKIYNPSLDKFTGTIAVKNKSLIKYELSEYDLGLLKTRAGIFYRDENLNGLNGEILTAHKNEVDNSDLISSSKYIKSFKSQNIN